MMATPFTSNTRGVCACCSSNTNMSLSKLYSPLGLQHTHNLFPILVKGVSLSKDHPGSNGRHCAGCSLFTCISSPLLALTVVYWERWKKQRPVDYGKIMTCACLLISTINCHGYFKSFPPQTTAFISTSRSKGYRASSAMHIPGATMTARLCATP